MSIIFFIYFFFLLSQRPRLSVIPPASHGHITELGHLTEEEAKSIDRSSNTFRSTSAYNPGETSLIVAPQVSPEINSIVDMFAKYDQRIAELEGEITALQLENQELHEALVDDNLRQSLVKKLVKQPQETDLLKMS